MTVKSAIISFTQLARVGLHCWILSEAAPTIGISGWHLWVFGAFSALQWMTSVSPLFVWLGTILTPAQSNVRVEEVVESLQRQFRASQLFRLQNWQSGHLGYRCKVFIYIVVSIKVVPMQSFVLLLCLSCESPAPLDVSDVHRAWLEYVNSLGQLVIKNFYDISKHEFGPMSW